MKIFVTGVAGQLGHDVVNELTSRGITAVGSDLAETYAGIQDGTAVTKCEYVSLDITDADAVNAAISSVKPDAVIHCAAWTAVDAAEDEDKQAKVFAINAEGTENIARACKTIDAKMMYISTAYVSDGNGCVPYKTTDNTNPLSGTLDKYFIVRIAWVFGVNGKNFRKTMLSVGKTHDSVRVVCDQIGTPTYTLDLSRLMADMIVTDKYGYYHATNEGGYISWYDFTKEIYAQAGLSTAVNPVTTAEYGLSKAARPFNSRLDKGKLVKMGFTPVPDWKDALARYLVAIGEK